MKVFIVMRAEEHSDYVEKVFFNKEHAEQYAAQFANNPNEYARNIEEHTVELSGDGSLSLLNTLEMKELVQALNRLAAAQKESNRISKLNTELLQSVLSTAQVRQQQNAKLLNQQPFSNPTIKDRQIMQQMTKIE